MDLTRERLDAAIRAPWTPTAGPDRRRLLTSTVESELIELYAAAGGPDSGVALAAVGSLARRELGPRSDLDLVLLHERRPGISALAERIWYPVWDSGARLDHSVRTLSECADVAGQEVSAGVGLLDLRLIAGDAELVRRTRTALHEAWRRHARKRLPELLDSIEERHRTAGDAAYLIEPDLKEARGGFRDVTMLRALAATWLTDRPHDEVNEPYERLLDVRDALHLASGRCLDRLVLAEAGDVASRLAYDGTDSLRRDVSLAARRIGHALEITGRAARRVGPERRPLFGRRERRPVFERADHGLIVHQGEVALDAGVDPGDPLLGLRAGALASRRGLVLSPVTAINLGKHARPLPEPWPVAAKDALLDLLAGGEQLIPVWDALDLAGLISTWISCWEPIRARPQHNPIHRHTVDRHSIQSVAEAARHLTHVDRPDLLLLAALFHDIGKLPGHESHHSETGAPIARRAVEIIGLAPADADVVERLVRHHLTLAELATRRDHADPATTDALVHAVDGRADLLALLRYLTEADARAAGPTAWSPWRAQLINGLADQTASLLISGSADRVDVSSLIDVGLARSVALDRRPRARVEQQPGGTQLVLAARDRVGLFSDTAGLLAALGVPVRSAMLHTLDGISVNTWGLAPRSPSDLPDPAYLVSQLERLTAGERAALDPLRRRESRAARQSVGSKPRVASISNASDTAAVIEVRAGDRPGLLWALGRSVAEAGFSIRSAHISTLAGQAIDTFYLTEADGRRPDPPRVDQAVDALRCAAQGLPRQRESSSG